jgi:hypothetical protein
MATETITARLYQERVTFRPVRNFTLFREMRTITPDGVLPSAASEVARETPGAPRSRVDTLFIRSGGEGEGCGGSDE